MEANPDFSSVSTPDLENSITRLSADLIAATYQQLIMIAEFDRRQGWGEEGVRLLATAQPVSWTKQYACTDNSTKVPGP